MVGKSNVTICCALLLVAASCSGGGESSQDAQSATTVAAAQLLDGTADSAAASTPSNSVTTTPDAASENGVAQSGATTCPAVVFEAESLDISGGWKLVNDPNASGGSYIAWEGLAREKNNNQPADVLSKKFVVSQPGTYKISWAMRQPSGVDGDKANDSWLNFPDADRFGPSGGGTYDGFIKVFGRSQGDFKFQGTADVNHKKSQIAIQFDTAGEYTFQVAGRSHGHQIDRVAIYHESISVEQALSGANCSPTKETSEPDEPVTEAPTAKPTNPSQAAGLYSTNDLISLHYDHAPDKDDGHATVAGRELTAKYGINPVVVGGAYGENEKTYNSDSEKVMDATWGNAWLNAHSAWDQSVDTAVQQWSAVLSSGGDIWIAEGGQSDFSADVVRKIKTDMPSIDTKSRIHLVQHSNWNERMTTDADLAYVRSETDYIKIEDGNSSNATANLNQKSRLFVEGARSGKFGDAWDAAFDYYNPNARLDFSDTVELLHILGVDKGEVSDPNDFLAEIINTNS